MDGDSKYPVRKSIRLKHFDYSQNGAYFVTICMRGRRHSFGEFVRDNSSCPEIVLNVAGKIANRCWIEIPDHFPNVDLDEFVIMPNHIHGIIIISSRGTACRAPTDAIEWFGKPTAGSIPTIIRSYKSSVTKHINNIYRTSGRSFWQRNYYEHVIRNEQDLHDIRKYINENPLRWETDEYNPVSMHHGID